jgi:tight adherence protein C
MTTLLNNEFAVLSMVFGSILMLALGVLSLMGRDRAAGRIQEIRSGTRRSETEGSGPVSLLYEDDRPKALRMLEPLQRTLTQSDPKQVTAARQRLIEAGFYRRTAVEAYFTSRLVLGVGLAVLSIGGLFWLAPGTSGLSKVFWVVASAAFGYYLPAALVSLRIRQRQEAFRLGMPDALDMMLVGVEAGLSLSASMKHIVKEFAHAHPIISEQFQIVSLEFQAGRSRSDALTGLAGRMNLPITRTLASMIIQAESLGTSLSQTLRVMAQELRTQRMLEGEKRAAELPVKMSVPLVLCIFPALMAVALVPAMLSTLTFFAELAK